MKTQISLWVTMVIVTILNLSYANAADTKITHHIVLAEDTQSALSIRDAQGQLITTFASSISDKNVRLATSDANSPQSVVIYHDQQVQMYSVNGKAIFSLPVAESGSVVQGQFSTEESAILFAPDTVNTGGLLYKTSKDNSILSPIAIPKSAWQPPVNIATIDIDNDGTDEIVVGSLNANQVAIYRINGQLINSFEVFNDSSRTRRSVREKTNTAGNSCDHNGNGTPTHCETTVITEPVTPPEPIVPPDAPPTPPITPNPPSEPEPPIAPVVTPMPENTPTSQPNVVETPEQPDLTTVQPSPTVPSPPINEVTQPSVTTPPVTITSPVIYGVKVATGDLDDDGKAEIVVGMASGGSKVQIYASEGQLIQEFQAFDTASGVELAIGDVNLDGQNDIVVAQAKGQQVRIFNTQGKLLESFTVPNLINSLTIVQFPAVTATPQTPSPEINENIKPVVTVPPSETAIAPTTEPTEPSQTQQPVVESPKPEPAPTVPPPPVADTTDSSEQKLPFCPLSGTVDIFCIGGPVASQDVNLTTRASASQILLAGNVQNQGLIANATVLPNATLQGGKLSGTIQNQGTLSDIEFSGMTLSGGNLAGTVSVKNKATLENVNILPDATVSNAMVSGTIHNQGTLADITVNSQTTVTGGTLQGAIQNQGTLNHLNLAEDTKISGGQLGGKITGASDNPLIENATILANAELSNVILGKATQVAAQITIGAGVRFDNNQQIPANVDLTAALVTDFTQGLLPIVDMNQDVVTGVRILSLLSQVNELDELKSNNWQLTQNLQTGALELTVDTVHFAIVPIQVVQTTEKAGLTVNSDGSVIFVTAQGRKIIAQPVVQDALLLKQALSLSDDALSLNSDGTLKLHSPDGWSALRASISSNVVPADKTLGIVLTHDFVPQSFTFVDKDGHKREQTLYPVCAYPQALQNYAGAGDLNIAENGSLTLTIDGQQYQAQCDHFVQSSPSTQATGQLGLTSVKDAQGNIISFTISYPTGERQTLWVKPETVDPNDLPQDTKVYDEKVSSCKAGRYTFDEDDTTTVNSGLRTEKFTPDQAKKISHDAAELNVTDGAVETEKVLGIKSLHNAEMPALDQGMINVTKGPRKGYRFLPHGTQFKNKVRVKLPYDKDSIPWGYTEQDVKTFYYDENSCSWKELARVAVDTTTQEVESETEHFTDMINSVMTVPDHPENASYNPTQFKDMKAADPSSGIALIEAPQANNMGDVRVSYGLEVPAGRVGMQPQVQISYSSAGGNGWLGQGWSLSTQEIGIDTRWGVPRYNAGLETETYVFNGQQLTPIVHRDTLKPRTAEKVFQSRVEGGFAKIIRHGDNPKNYWWEVIDKNGITSYFGGNAATHQLAPDAVLTDDQGNIFRWALRDVVDTHGNNIQYRYVKVTDVGLPGGSVPGYDLYLKTINYTGFDNAPGLYQVNLIRDRELNEPRRSDVMISGMGGFKQVTADLLRKIEVKYQGQSVRSYELKYQGGAFGKTLLTAITQYGKEGGNFYSHTFDYYNDVAGGLFGAAQSWNTGNDGVSAGFFGFGTASAISGNKSDSIGGHLYIGINLLLPTKEMSIGGKVGFSRSTSDGMLAQMDINGDGLPDKVYKKGGTIYYRPNRSGPNGITQFGEPRLIANLSDISKGRSNMFSGGPEIYLGASIGLNIAGTSGTTTVFFTEVNGDGLPDLVDNGLVLFNHLDNNGNSYFSANSTDTPYPIGAGAVDIANLALNLDKERQEFAKMNPLLDTVRRWTAPYDGEIQITGNIALLPPTDRQGTEDGVRVAIQHNDLELWASDIAATDYTPKSPAGLINISVKQGDVVYFRVQSQFDGTNDQVNWQPEIQYLNIEPFKDANNFDFYRFNAKEDFVLTGYRDVALTVPLTGKIQVAGQLQKTAVTTDDVAVRLVLNDQIIDEQILSWKQTGAIKIDQNISVKKDDKLALRVKIDSPIDLSKLQWSPAVKLTYLEAEGIETVNDPDGNPAIQMDMMYSMDVYSMTRSDLPFSAWKTSSSGIFTVTPNLALGAAKTQAGTETKPLNATITMTVKRRGELLAKHEIQIENDVLNNNGNFTFTANKDDELFFEFSTQSTEAAERITQIDAGVSGNSVPSVLYSASQNGIIAPAYRNWTLFGYDGNDERKTQPLAITEADLNGENLKADMEKLAQQKDSLKPELLQQDNPQLPELPHMKIVPFYPQATTGHWGANPQAALASPEFADMAVSNARSSAWVSAEQMSSSRNGLSSFDAPEPSAFAGRRGIVKYNNSRQMSVMLGAGFLSGSLSRSTSQSYMEMMDFNGDRFADILGGCIQYTDMLGALLSGCGPGIGSEVRATKGDSANIGVGANFPLKRPGGNVRNQMASLGISVNGNWGENDTIHDIMDVNGDSLPDLVFEGLRVALNLGYRFAAPEPWGGAEINSTRALMSMGVNAGFNTGIYGFGGGISVTKSGSESTKMLSDVNGDGLSDSVRGAGASFNTGNGFGGGSLSTDEKSTSGDITLGGGVYFTIAIPIGIPPAGFFIIINPGFDLNRAVTRQEIAFADIDGDGNPDLLESTRDGSVSVRPSNVRRTNMLRTVHNPLGGSMTVDYARTGNTYAQPQNRWVMSRVEVNDGHAGDGVDTLVSTYRYEDGFYNRLERDFYGFKTLVEEHRDHSQGDSLYRYITRTFLNNSYYNKGLLIHEVMTDAAGHKYSETENNYFLRNLDTNSELANLDHLTATVFPELRRVDKQFYEGLAVAGKFTYETYQYDDVGNITQFFDAGDVGTADDIDATIGYFKNPAKHILSKANSIVVKSNGTVLRQREGSVANNGDVTQVRQYLETGQVVAVDLSYDKYGNMTSVVGPANYKGQRYTLDYLYDNSVYTHNINVKDSFGYTSSSQYDLAFGKVLKTIDINNNPIDYVYDQFGRVQQVVGPYQTGSGLYTLSFEYHPEARPAYALTQHIDVYRNSADPIETVLFVDGLKRALQTKKDAAIHMGENGQAQDNMIVSGLVMYDFLGRSVAQYYPITESLGRQGIFNAGVDSIQPTVTQYDVIDRAISTTLPDNTVTRMEYGFGADRNGTTQFLTRVIDANGIAKETYKDIDESITSVKEFNDGGKQIIWTSYDYDPLNQIVKVLDDKNNPTTVKYDNLGRRTQIDNLDTGLTETFYDLASNVVKKVTANLRASGQAIAYDYDYNRLNRIIYPSFTGNNVTYTYGAPGAAFNRANRAITVSDESGVEEFFYGKLGEAVKTIKTVASDTLGKSAQSPEIYTTVYEYDTFNRLQKLVYPDGEVLTNHYDSGGSLRAINGLKDGNDYEYLNRLEYDKFEQRVFVELGNKVKTHYTYDERNRRLANLQAGNGKGSRQFQNLTYQYDNVGNILGQSNLAAVESPSQMGGATQFKYQYDDLYRLVHAEGQFDTQPRKQHTYRLDMVYNSIHNIQLKDQLHELRESSGTILVQKPTTYKFEYQYAAKQPHAPTHIGEKTYTYDANGNQTGWTDDVDGTNRKIVWDEENRIQEIIDNKHVMSYKYNASGERVIKMGPQGETVYVNQFFVIRGGAVGTKHVFAGSARMVTKLAKQENPTIKSNNAGSGGKDKGPRERDMYFYHPDHLGSSSYVTDEGGRVFQHLEYFPFGETWVEEKSNTQRTPYLFTGKELDEDTGLYYFGARYYDQRTSVWVSVDPILDSYLNGKVGMGGVYNSFNLGLYTYTHLNPIKYLDPDGRLTYKYEQKSFYIDKGDTLTSISGRTGFSIGQIMGANPQIKNADMIYAGSKINIPYKTVNGHPVPNGVSVDDNIAEARKHPLVSRDATKNFGWFWNQVKTGGPQDYKNLKDKNGNASPWFEYFGNYNFGAVSRAVGFNEEITAFGAGTYQIKSRISMTNNKLSIGNFSVNIPGVQLKNYDKSWSDAYFKGSYGDDPRDTEAIRAGSKYFDNQ